MRTETEFYDFDDPEQCVTCNVELPETNSTGFCSGVCEDAYIKAKAAEADALCRDLAEEARLAEAAKQQDRFEVPERLRPSTVLGLALTQMFMTTPANERV